MPTSVLPALPTFRGRSFLMVFAIVAALIFSSGSFAAPSAEANEKLKRAVQITAAQKGDPYQYGAAGPNRFDCSGLLYYSFRRAGFTNIPRTSSQQANFTKRIPRNRMKRGDFVFFTNSNGSVYHVGVYGGRNKKTGKRFLIHSPSSGKRVHRAPIWANNWFAGTVRHRL